MSFKIKERIFWGMAFAILVLITLNVTHSQTRLGDTAVTYILKKMLGPNGFDKIIFSDGTDQDTAAGEGGKFIDGDDPLDAVYTIGNVGIGTTNPSAELHIDGGANTGIKINASSGGGCLMIRDTDNLGWSECFVLDAVLSCSVDADGICDGS